MTIFVNGAFRGHAGLTLPFKIECDALTDDDLDTLARIVARRITYGEARGVPSGGIQFATALNRYKHPLGLSDYPLLICDDVLTTGKSMTEFRNATDVMDVRGVVIFARNDFCPDWIIPIFSIDRRLL